MFFFARDFVFFCKGFCVLFAKSFWFCFLQKVFVFFFCKDVWFFQRVLFFSIGFVCFFAFGGLCFFALGGLCFFQGIFFYDDSHRHDARPPHAFVFVFCKRFCVFLKGFFFSVFFVFEIVVCFYFKWCDFISHGVFFFSKGAFFFGSFFQKKSKISIFLFPKVFQFQSFFFSNGLCFSSCDGFLFKSFSSKQRVLIFENLF